VDRVLAVELGRVRAPEELWERIERPRTLPSGRGSVTTRKGLALAAAVLIAVVVWGLYPRGLVIQSTDAVRIRDWVKANAGLDVPLLAELPASLRLTGARVSRGRAEINCRVGDRDAKLIVARTGSGVSERHSQTGRRIASWAMRGQSYTLACANPEDLKMACLLCHSGGA